jgi:hypothetical protein
MPGTAAEAETGPVPTAPPTPKTVDEALEYIEDSLEQIISDSIDMDWQPRWAARAIVEKLKKGQFSVGLLQRLDQVLS